MTPKTEEKRQELEAQIRWTLDYLVREAEDIRREAIKKLETDTSKMEPVFASFYDPAEIGTYDLQHSMTWLLVNMRLDDLARLAARYASLRGDLLKEAQ